MSYVDGIDEIDEDRKVGLYQNIPIHDGPIPISEREDAEAIRKTVALSQNITPDIPSHADSSLVGRVLSGPATSPNLSAIEADLENYAEKLKSIAKSPKALNETVLPNFPNLAFESVKAGLAKEELTNRKLNGLIQEAEKHQKDIDLLLDFSSEITAMPDSAEEPTEKIKELLAELKKRGIDVVKGDLNRVNKEKISEIKSQVSARIDKSRSDLQILFTTKIQVLIQNIGAIMETLKDIVRNHSRLANTIIGHYAGR